VVLATASIATALHAQCPESWDDAGVPIDDPNPPAPPGTPELTVDGIFDFVLSEGLGSVSELLDHIPPSLQKNYALMEETRTEGLADVDNPRLLLLGSDMRFLIALATHPADPKRETVDMAELEDETGFWKFRSLDMSTTPPTLSENDASCTGCHGIPARPIWGSYPDWPGAFGEDNDILTTAQANSLNQIRNTQASSDRFHTIELLNQYNAGQIFSLPGRVYPYTNTITNMELGAAVADGVYTRVKNSPLYEFVWRELLLMSYCSGEVPDFFNTPAYAQIVENLSDLGAPGTNKDDIYLLLGVDVDNDFSLDRLAFETPDPGWNVSTDSLYGLVDLLILYDLAKSRTSVRAFLAGLPHLDTPFSDGCFDTLAEATAYKNYQAWTLRGAARQAAREADFDVDLLRSHQGIYDQADGLCDALMSSILN